MCRKLIEMPINKLKSLTASEKEKIELILEVLKIIRDFDSSKDSRHVKNFA